MRACADETAVLVVDYQEKLIPAMAEKEEFIRRTNILLQGLIALKVPVIVTQQYTKGLGETVFDIKSIKGMPEAFDKITFSCIKDDNILEALDDLGVDNVIVCGCEAHICVLQTVIDLIDEGYNVYLVSDCITSRKLPDKEAAIMRAVREGAYITSCEAILFELLEKAGSETFKLISGLIK